MNRLEDLLRLPSFPEYRTEVARIVRRDFNTWWQRLEIRKGRNHGIPEGAPVVFSGGIVGRVTEVHATTAVVDLVSSPTLRIAATVWSTVSQPMSLAKWLKVPAGNTTSRYSISSAATRPVPRMAPRHRMVSSTA